VITSQYFIWFLIFLPHYLAQSKLYSNKHMMKGIVALLLWIVSQGSWLYFAYQLEFLGISTFDNGLLFSSFFFYISNCWILSVFIDDLNNDL
jgi:phosphatidylinositol glycan class M